jgi:NAD(P)-dependent dehydrogenase (short-subunit alcohol dehydrogenase family)
VALVGRHSESLTETAHQIGGPAGQALICPCDIGKWAAVEEMGRRVLREFKEVEVLVNAAGTNAPRRALEVLSMEDYHAMIDTNLNGAYYCVQAFLPQMRARGSGTIVNIVSDAGRQASPKAGPAYVMSKFGLAGLTQSINAEERTRGVRACAIFPGDIDTPLLEKRPVVPHAEARARMLQSEDVAECALLAINLPPRALVEELVIRPR